MQVVLAIFSAGLLGLIIYFAVSPKSSRLLKRTALAALGLIGLSLGVCGIFLIKGPSNSPEIVPLPVFEESTPPVRSSNTLMIIVFFLIFLFVLGLIIFLSLRGQRKKGEEPKKDEKSPIFSNDDELNIQDLDDKEDSFDIETE